MKYEISNVNIELDIKKKTNIIIGADFVPTLSNKRLFINSDIEELLGNELAGLFLNSDLNILNLEVPITKCEIKLKKVGSPNLKTYPESLGILEKIKPLVLSGANNHIYDYMQMGINDTLHYLDSKKFCMSDLVVM